MHFHPVSDAVLTRVRRICLALPETEETPAWTGRFFKIRRRTFAHVFALEDPEGHLIPMLVCTADPGEREVLLRMGHPFFAPRNGAARVGVVLNAATDWREIAELLTESFVILAPKKLGAACVPPA